MYELTFWGWRSGMTGSRSSHNVHRHHLSPLIGLPLRVDSHQQPVTFSQMMDLPGGGGSPPPRRMRGYISRLIKTKAAAIHFRKPPAPPKETPYP